MINLDSDIFTLLTYGHANVHRHYEDAPEDEQIAVIPGIIRAVPFSLP